MCHPEKYVQIFFKKKKIYMERTHKHFPNTNQSNNGRSKTYLDNIDNSEPEHYNNISYSLTRKGQHTCKASRGDLSLWWRGWWVSAVKSLSLNWSIIQISEQTLQTVAYTTTRLSFLVRSYSFINHSPVMGHCNIQINAKYKFVIC